jgi:hypothetical protein
MNNDSIVRTTYVLFRAWKCAAQGTSTIEDHITSKATLGDRQQLGLPFGEPLSAGRGLALGAAAITTRVEYFDAMSAPVALVQMTTQDRGPAVTNVSERFSLLARQRGVPASQESVLMGAEDIGQF